jgi:hypothetical protein
MNTEFPYSPSQFLYCEYHEMIRQEVRFAIFYFRLLTIIPLCSKWRYCLTFLYIHYQLCTVKKEFNIVACRHFAG